MSLEEREERNLSNAVHNLLKINDTTSGDDQTSEEDEPMGLADAIMMRGSYLRHLRLLEETDNAQRNQEEDSASGKEEIECKIDCHFLENAPSTTKNDGEDRIEVLDDGRKMLVYESYLAHQRYYDDLKHIDVSLIDYGNLSSTSRECRMIIEQRKILGKGGLCWDAAFILGEHLIANEQHWEHHLQNYDKHLGIDDKPPNFPRVVELGAGTGLTGLMLAKACECHVTITDLPEILDLMQTNLNRNFDSKSIVPLDTDEMTSGNEEESNLNDNKTESESLDQTLFRDDLKFAKGSAWASVLRWGHVEDYTNAPFDIIIGADVVASIYDPVALADTFHALSGPNTKIYVSYKGRLTEPHRTFEDAMHQLFRQVKRVQPQSRNKNPGVWILEIEGKI